MATHELHDRADYTMYARSDAYIESTGRTRIDYTREEWLAGASWSFADAWRLYGEYGYGFDLRNEELMEPGRYQLGLEYQPAPTRWRGRAGWYAAADVSAYEEDEWDTNLTLQTGMAFYTGVGSGVWRFGVEFYDGRSQIGEFFQDEETHFAWGLWFDF